MKKFFFLSILIIITTACGIPKPNTHSNRDDATSTNSLPYERSDKAVETVLKCQPIDQGVKIIFILKNNTDHTLNYTFNTGQRFDFEIKKENGEIVYRYSAHRMFTQVIGKLILKKNEKKTYETTVKGLEPGTYAIRIWLTDNDNQPETKGNFTIK